MMVAQTLALSPWMPRMLIQPADGSGRKSLNVQGILAAGTITASIKIDLTHSGLVIIRRLGVWLSVRMVVTLAGEQNYRWFKNNASGC